ncbi:MAG: acyltransferase family protein [Chthoniobacterales bacterium]
MSAAPLRYIAPLDGIRGLAAISVIATHYGYSQYGWINVEFFFVLSGFLITSILLSDKDRPLKESLRRFYWRRALRVFPLYFGYLSVCTLCYLLLGEPAELKGAFVSLVTYTHNFYLLSLNHGISFFFSHLWSLSVEEQFYFLWPFLIFVLSTANVRRVIITIVLLVPLLRVALLIYLRAQGYPESRLPWTLYLVTIFQLDAFAVGAAIALFRLTRRIIPPWKLGLAVGCALLLGIWESGSPILGHRLSHSELASGDEVTRVLGGASFGYPILMVRNAQFLWGYTMINLLSVMLIITTSQTNIVSKFFGNRFLCYLGRMSYGIYVFHFSIQSFFTKAFPVDPYSLAGFLVFLALLATIISVAHLSYFHFEKRFLAMKDCFEKRQGDLPISASS